ncbi:hypothetical protein SUGI_0248560 [Cryptomeria japonica]|nr:hypothetical protein SUGI_0248560 [Cryptomeria japonica]
MWPVQYINCICQICKPEIPQISVDMADGLKMKSHLIQGGGLLVMSTVFLESNLLSRQRLDRNHVSTKQQ